MILSPHITFFSIHDIYYIIHSKHIWTNLKNINEKRLGNNVTLQYFPMLISQMNTSIMAIYI